jgi:selenocysteine lyase/cysteine desulfurase
VRQFLGAANAKEIVFLRGTTEPREHRSVAVARLRDCSGRAQNWSLWHASRIRLGRSIRLSKSSHLRTRGVPVLIDGAQSAPHLPVNVTALDADFFVFSAHKVFGPTGIGALYGKAHLLEQMPWQGGDHMIKDVTFAKATFQHAPEKSEAGTPW